MSKREIALWTVSAVVVVAAHAGIAAAVSAWSELDAGGAPTAVMIELAPMASESAAEHANLPIAPLNEEQTEPDPKPEPQREPEKVETEPEPEQKVAEVQPQPEPPLPPTPPVKTEITLSPEAPKEHKPPPPKKKVAIATAPERADRVAPRQRASQAGAAAVSPNVMASYAANVIRPHLLRHISSGRLKDGGIVVVTFSITRQGRLTTRHVSKSSGHSEIDSEALSTVQRAQPYPPPPPELTQQSFMFSVPMRYNMR